MSLDDDDLIEEDQNYGNKTQLKHSKESIQVWNKIGINDPLNYTHSRDQNVSS